MTDFSFDPVYLKLSLTEIKERAEQARQELSACRLCPRECGVNRLRGEVGSCRNDATLKIASYGPHFGEERPLVGTGGSGTIFFSGCSLRCVFCQNHNISRQYVGAPSTTERLGQIMLELQARGCHNINFVTPTHFIPQIITALAHVYDSGLKLPLVYNSSGYDNVGALKLMENIIDIYMPDFKYSDGDTAGKLSRARNYPEAAKTAIMEMHRQVGDLVIDASGIARRGLIVRHLVLPEKLAGTDEFVNWLANKISLDTYLNLMDQYHPAYKAGAYPPLDRHLTTSEFDQAIKETRKSGLRRPPV